MTTEEFNAQIMPAARKLLATSGPVAVLLMNRYGLAQEDVSLWFDLAIAAGPLLIALAWGARTHTTAGKIEAVTKLPDVQEIVTRKNPESKSIAAIASPTGDPKVTEGESSR